MRACVLALALLATASGCTQARAQDPPTRHLTGSDIYRLNCQSCHGAGGAGTAQAPSLEKALRAIVGTDGDGDLKRRLASGGERMPAFPHLGDAELEALVGYLRELGGGPPSHAPAVPALTGTVLGERIYRANCASCHEANRVGVPGMMCRPESLAGATQRFSKRQVMNLLDVGVGPMPAFSHLTAEERDALWAFLETLPAPDGARTTMGQMCPMVRAAMEGRAMMRGGGMMGMMGRGMGCPMMRSRSGASSGASEEGPMRMPPCCGGR